ncbi:MAG TPA: twin-arginine translocase TatA/TatE family subunit [Vicinamibacterales bacterium]|nr:twin-arginine translocase TatA/TatE family subunit [Vicinamibacterales bacterium]
MEFGLPEFLILVAIVVLVYGERRLREIGRGLGGAIRTARDRRTPDDPRNRR